MYWSFMNIYQERKIQTEKMDGLQIDWMFGNWLRTFLYPVQRQLFVFSFLLYFNTRFISWITILSYSQAIHHIPITCISHVLISHCFFFEGNCMIYDAVSLLSLVYLSKYALTTKTGTSYCCTSSPTAYYTIWQDQIPHYSSLTWTMASHFTLSTTNILTARYCSSSD